MVLVDSVGWLAYFMDDAMAGAYEPYLLASDDLLCSTLNVFEVHRRVEQSAGRRAAAEAVAQLQRATVVPVDLQVAVTAAALSVAQRLAMADAVIYATAQLHDATLVTSDAHFDGLPGVIFLPRQGA